MKKNKFLIKNPLETGSRVFDKVSESLKKENYFDLERLTIRRKETLVFANVNHSDSRFLRNSSGMKELLLN